MKTPYNIQIELTTSIGNNSYSRVELIKKLVKWTIISIQPL